MTLPCPKDPDHTPHATVVISLVVPLSTCAVSGFSFTAMRKSNSSAGMGNASDGQGKWFRERLQASSTLLDYATHSSAYHSHKMLTHMKISSSDVCQMRTNIPPRPPTLLIPHPVQKLTPRATRTPARNTRRRGAAKSRPRVGDVRDDVGVPLGGRRALRRVACIGGGQTC